MPTKTENLKIENVKDGAVIEKINFAIGLLMDDINNPNKEAAAPREVSIKLIFKPTEDRDLIGIGCAVNPKFGPLKTIKSRAAIGIDARGRGFAREIVPMEQQKLPLENVTRIDERKVKE